MTTQIVVTLTPDEMKFLRERARDDCRKPNQQARYLLLQALGVIDAGKSHGHKNSKSAESYQGQGAFAGSNP